MNDDDFETAARAEARDAWDFQLNPASSTPEEDLGQHMAVWARDHLAAQEPTDAERAEAAMDELGCELRVVENGSTTCDTHGGYATSDDVCEVVHMVLTAARAVGRED